MTLVLAVLGAIIGARRGAVIGHEASAAPDRPVTAALAAQTAARGWAGNPHR